MLVASLLAIYIVSVVLTVMIYHKDHKIHPPETLIDTIWSVCFIILPVVNTIVAVAFRKHLIETHNS